MHSTLAYGLGSTLEIDLPADGEVLTCRAPRGVALADVQAATLAALRTPLAFPPLAQCAVPGDKVGIALDAGVPQAESIVAAIVGELLSRGVSAADIAVLRTPEDAAAGAASPLSALPAAAREVALVEHRGEDRAELSYLAADERGNEIYLNRLLADADLAVSIGCVRLEPAAGYYGLAGGFWPAFADRAAQSNARGRKLSDRTNADVAAGAGEARVQRTADKVRWLLGSQFAVAAVPGGGDDVLTLLAGESGHVRTEGQRLAGEAWRIELPRPADLVVAGIGGGPAQQQWTQVARALAAAHQVLFEGGAMVVCSDLQAGPGEAVTAILQAEDRAEALRRLRKSPPDDLVAATQICWALDAGSVYFLSRLPADQVEELGLTPIADGGEIGRMARGRRTVALIENAQHARPIVASL